MMNRVLLKLLLFLFLITFTSGTCMKRLSKPKGMGFPEDFIPEGIGVNIHFSGAPAQDMSLINEAHIKLIRADLTWAQIEKEKNKYDFSRYDKLMDACEKNGIRILFILDYQNRLYGEEKSIRGKEQRKGFARFAGEAAKHFQGKGVMWEIWNEPNIAKFWGEEPNVDDYMKLLKVTSRAIRHAAPGAIIVAPATCGCDGGFIEKCGKLGMMEIVDGVSVHPYREGGPESVLRSYNSLHKIIDKYKTRSKKRPRILSSEWGWGLPYLDIEVIGGKGAELRQAAYLTRRFCTEALAGIACAIHYKWREDNHGLVRTNYSLKPSYRAFEILNEQLTGYSSDVSRLEMGDKEKDFILLFRGELGDKIVAWRTEGESVIAIPLKRGKAKVIDFLGETVDFRIEQDTLHLTIDGQPVFIGW